jgi:hypothetical protein
VEDYRLSSAFQELFQVLQVADVYNVAILDSTLRARILIPTNAPRMAAAIMSYSFELPNPLLTADS